MRRQQGEKQRGVLRKGAATPLSWQCQEEATLLPTASSYSQREKTALQECAPPLS